MAAKGFCVKIDFDLQAITCPGVWLCPNGTVALRINAFNSHIQSRKTTPIFPLLFNDKFLFRKIFPGVCSLSDLQCCLENEFIYAELIQWPSVGCKGVILGTFETNLVDLLYPVPCFKGLLSGTDVDLLMECSKYFPGIIAPKIEISTRTVIEEVVGIRDSDIAGSHVINPKLINSKGRPCVHRKKPPVGIVRQRKVCHSQGRPKSPSTRCQHHHHHYCLTDSLLVSSRTKKSESHVNQCYQNTNKSSKSLSPGPCRRVLESSALHHRYHDLDDCSVCVKYRTLFPKKSNHENICQGDSDTRKEAIYGVCDVSNCTEHASSKSTSSLLQRMRNLQRCSR
ncbi:spermatogenesis-associated protein 6 [Diachasmimorpha longicaudata]|uniref:spermatogenesis-associated protein 6 n=1 Tax=Diachasmimorpha longicaudata TaxID=58733 RepID=UPI0030B905F9